MSDKFRSFVKYVAETAGFPIVVYEPSAGIMRRYKGAREDVMDIPPILRASLDDENIRINFFVRNGSPLVVYFLRIVCEGTDYVLLINDLKNRQRLNAVFQCMISGLESGIVVYEKRSSTDLGEEVSGKEAAISADEKNSVLDQRKEVPIPRVFANSGEKSSETKEELEGRIADSLRRQLYERDRVIADLRRELESKSALEEAVVRGNGTIDMLSSKMASLEENKRLAVESSANLEIKLSELDKKYAELAFDYGETVNLTAVLRKSRDKLLTLIDGIDAPLYSVSSSYKIVHANKALAKNINCGSVSELVGMTCYETVFGNAEPCPWCMIKEVGSTGENRRSEINLKRDGKYLTFDIYCFPIVDKAGEIIDYGETYIDKTESVEMESSLHKFREQIRTFKKNRLSDINELNDIKKSYAELLSSYESVCLRNDKMTRTLETLMSQDASKEILAAKTEVVEYKNKLSRAYEAIKNYQRNVASLQLKYNDLNKRTFFQMERLINVMNSRYGASSEDISSALALVAKTVGELGKNLKKETPADGETSNGDSG